MFVSRILIDRIHLYVNLRRQISDGFTTAQHFQHSTTCNNRNLFGYFMYCLYPRISFNKDKHKQIDRFIHTYTHKYSHT